MRLIRLSGLTVAETPSASGSHRAQAVGAASAIHAQATAAATEAIVETTTAIPMVTPVIAVATIAALAAV